MSSEGDDALKAPPGGGEPSAAPIRVLRTVVGVPALDASGKGVPPSEPSETSVVEAVTTGGAPVAPESNTAVDVSAMSSAEADRVLAWTGFTQEEIPTVHGSSPPAASPHPPDASSSSYSTSGEGTTKHVSMPTRIGAASMSFEPRGTTRGIAPPQVRTPMGMGALRPQTHPPPTSMKPPPPSMRPMPSKRATLVMDAGAPFTEEPPSTTMERAPINVPAAGALQPKAVTQPPPWGEGRVQLGVPKPGGLPGSARPPEESIEEISASVFLPEDEDLAKTRIKAPKVEELSGSLLLPADADDLEKTRLRGPVVEEMSGSILLPDDSGAARPVPTQRGHANLPRAIPKTKESPVHATPSSKPLPVPASRFPAPPPPAVQPSRLPTPPPPAVHAPTPLPPPNRTMLGMAAPVAAAPLPLPPEPAPLTQVGVPFLATDDPSLPPGVPVPEPPALIVHPAWPPPHIEPPAATQHSPVAPDPFAGLTHSSAPPPHLTQPTPGVGFHIPGTSSAPPPAPRLESTDHFIPSTSILRNRPKWFLPALIGGGAVIGIGLLGLLVSLFTSSGSDDSNDAANKRATGGAARTIATVASNLVASKPAPASPLPSPSTSTSTTPPATPSAPSGAACTTAGGAHVIAPRAVISAGVEAIAVEGGIALGIAPTDREGMAVLLDPSSLVATSTARTKSFDNVRRVTPQMNAKKSLYAVADADKKTDRLHGRRFVPGDPSIDVGASGSSLVAASHGGNGGSKLWELPVDGAVDAVRGVSFSLNGEKSYAIAFRRGSSVFVGVATGEGKALTAKGALSKLDGLGEKIGSPAIAVTGDSVLVAWADRRFDNDPWTLRFVVFKAGADAGTPQSFSPPTGGLGSNVMSPGVIGVAGNRFLLVWTEGPVDSHQVRGQTLRADGTALGAALLLSSEGVNAGQGQAAIGADGKGVVAFLDGSKREVIATPVACPR